MTEDRETLPRTTAKLPGRCACCDCPIRPGDRIEKHDRGWRLADCPGDVDNEHEMGDMGLE